MSVDVTHLSKIAIQEARDEANENRDRGIETTTYASQANGGLGDTAFFVASRKYRVVAIRYVHGTAGTDAGAVTLAVRKCTGTQAPSAGATLMSGTFDCKGTINSVQTATLTSTLADLELAVGDRLALDFTGTLTALAGVACTVMMIPV